MKKQSLFQYAIIWHPTEKEVKDSGLKAKLIVEPSTILAIDQDTAKISASMSIPNEYKGQLDQVEILMRPF